MYEIKKEGVMKKIIFVLIAVCSLVVTGSSVFAHSGRTDSYGGHWNRVDYGIPVYEYHGF